MDTKRADGPQLVSQALAQDVCRWAVLRGRPSFVHRHLAARAQSWASGYQLSCHYNVGNDSPASRVTARAKHRDTTEKWVQSRHRQPLEAQLCGSPDRQYPPCLGWSFSFS